MSEQLREAMDLLHKARLDSIHHATDKAALRNEIERLREIIAMTDNRLEAAMLDGGVCEHCIEVARSYLQEVALLSSPDRATNSEQEGQGQ